MIRNRSRPNFSNWDGSATGWNVTQMSRPVELLGTVISAAGGDWAPKVGNVEDSFITPLGIGSVAANGQVRGHGGPYGDATRKFDNLLPLVVGHFAQVHPRVRLF